MSSNTVSTHRVLADFVTANIVNTVALIVGGATFVGLLAQVSIPLGFTPVPVTGQTLGVLMVGSDRKITRLSSSH